MRVPRETLLKKKLAISPSWCFNLMETKGMKHKQYYSFVLKSFSCFELYKILVLWNHSILMMAISLTEHSSSEESRFRILGVCSNLLERGGRAYWQNKKLQLIVVKQAKPHNSRFSDDKKNTSSTKRNRIEQRLVLFQSSKFWTNEARSKILQIFSSTRTRMYHLSSPRLYK